MLNLTSSPVLPYSCCFSQPGVICESNKSILFLSIQVIWKITDVTLISTDNHLLCYLEQASGRTDSPPQALFPRSWCNAEVWVCFFHFQMNGVTPSPVDATISSCSWKKSLEGQPECPEPFPPQQQHCFLDTSADLAAAEDQINPKEEPSPLRAENALALRLSSAKYLLQQIAIVCLGFPSTLIIQGRNYNCLLQPVRSVTFNCSSVHHFWKFKPFLTLTGRPQLHENNFLQHHQKALDLSLYEQL